MGPEVGILISCYNVLAWAIPILLVVIMFLGIFTVAVIMFNMMYNTAGYINRHDVTYVGVGLHFMVLINSIKQRTMFETKWINWLVFILYKLVVFSPVFAVIAGFCHFIGIF